MHVLDGGMKKWLNENRPTDNKINHDLGKFSSIDKLNPNKKYSVTEKSELIKNKFPSHHNIEIVNKTHNDQFINCEIASELISRGWENEVISFTRQKKSIISRIFSFFFK